MIITMQKPRVAKLPLVHEPQHVVKKKKGYEVNLKSKILARLLPKVKQEVESGQNPNDSTLLCYLIQPVPNPAPQLRALGMERKADCSQYERDFKKLPHAFDS